MSVINVDKDFDALTITLTAEFDAPVELVWQLWEDRGCSSAGGAHLHIRRRWSSSI